PARARRGVHVDRRARSRSKSSNPQILKSSNFTDFLMPVVMDADRIGRTLTRIAHEILERNAAPGDVDDLALVGIRTRGVPLARRIAHIIGAINQHEVPT